MSEKIIVLQTSGKHERVEYAKVFLFSSKESADKFIKYTNTGKTKYWVKAEIVQEGKSVELIQPEEGF